MVYEHIHPEFRHVMGMSDKEAIAFMDSPRWVGYESAQFIIETLHDLMNKPPRPRTFNKLIVGDSNNGKTTIIRRFYDLYGQAYVNEESEPVKPIVIAESPPSADEKSLYISILEQYATPYRATETASKLRYQVIHMLRYCHTKMLIIDEFHSLLTGSAIKQREVLNAIKLICNETTIPIVGVGTKEAVRVLHSDAQLASRFDVIELKGWEQDRRFQKLLAGFEKILPLKHPSKLHQAKLAGLIYTISEGNTGNVHRLLMECAAEAIKTGVEKIDESIIDSKKWLRPTRGVREVGF